MGLQWQMEMKAHLREHRPKVYREVVRTGHLDGVR